MLANISSPSRVPTMGYTSTYQQERTRSPTWSIYEDAGGGEDDTIRKKGGDGAGEGTTVTAAADPHPQQLRDSYKKVCVLARGAQGVVYAATVNNKATTKGSSGALKGSAHLTDSDNDNSNSVVPSFVAGGSSPLRESTMVVGSAPDSKGIHLVAIKRFINDYNDVQSRGMPANVLREVSMHRLLERLWGCGDTKGSAEASSPSSSSLSSSSSPFVQLHSILHGPHKEVCAALEYCSFDLSSERFCKGMRALAKGGKQRGEMAAEVGSSSSCSGPEKAHAVIRFILTRALKALAFMHKNEILHRDVKPSNILLRMGGEKVPAGSSAPASHTIGDGGDRTVSVKLGDLGSSKRLMMTASNSNSRGARAGVEERGASTRRDRHQHHRAMTPAVRCTTLLYRSPETILGLGATRYGKPADVWAMGVVFAELLSLAKVNTSSSSSSTKASASGGGGGGLDHLFAVTGEMHLAGAMLKLLGPMRGTECFLMDDDGDDDGAAASSASTPPLPQQEYEGTMRLKFADSITTGNGAYDLLTRMLAMDPRERITAEEALRHPYLMQQQQQSTPSAAVGDEQLDASVAFVTQFLAKLCTAHDEAVFAKGGLGVRPPHTHHGQQQSLDGGGGGGGGTINTINRYITALHHLGSPSGANSLMTAAGGSDGNNSNSVPIHSMITLGGMMDTTPEHHKRIGALKAFGGLQGLGGGASSEDDDNSVGGCGEVFDFQNPDEIDFGNWGGGGDPTTDYEGVDGLGGEPTSPVNLLIGASTASSGNKVGSSAVGIGIGLFPSVFPQAAMVAMGGPSPTATVSAPPPGMVSLFPAAGGGVGPATRALGLRPTAEDDEDSDMDGGIAAADFLASDGDE